jgi:hypothetical protein
MVDGADGRVAIAGLRWRLQHPGLVPTVRGRHQVRKDTLLSIGEGGAKRRLKVLPSAMSLVQNALWTAVLCSAYLIVEIYKLAYCFLPFALIEWPHRH